MRTVRVAFRVRYEMPSVPTGTMLQYLPGIYVKTNWMSVFSKLRANPNYGVINIYVTYYVTYFVTKYFTFQKYGGWNDSVSLLLGNDKGGERRRNSKVGPSGQELHYEPEYFRWFATVRYMYILHVFCYVLCLYLCHVFARCLWYLYTKETAGCSSKVMTVPTQHVVACQLFKVMLFLIARV